MKIALFLTTLLSAAPALACSEEMIATAQETVERAQARSEAGVAAPLELLVAKKALIDAKVCEKLESDENDIKLVVQSIENARERKGIVDRLSEALAIGAFDAELVRTEVEGFRKTCPALRERAQKLVEAGMAQAADAKALDVVCVGL